MKKKSVLIILVVFICSLAGVFVNNYQKKLGSQQTQVAANKNTNNHKSETKQNTDNSISETKQNTNISSTKILSSDSTTSSNNSTNSSNNSTKQPAIETSKKVAVNIQTSAKSSQPANVFITNNVNGTATICTDNESVTGKTVESVTKEVLDKKNINYSDRGGYFSMIDNFKERGAGEKSGWCFYVNGNKSSVGVSSYTLKSGDKLEWKYWSDALNN